MAYAYITFNKYVVLVVVATGAGFEKVWAFAVNPSNQQSDTIWPLRIVLGLVLGL
jgi:hypothetical protein